MANNLMLKEYYLFYKDQWLVWTMVAARACITGIYEGNDPSSSELYMIRLRILLSILTELLISL